MRVCVEETQTEIRELCNVLNVPCLNRSVNVFLLVELVRSCVGFDYLLYCWQFIRIHFEGSRCFSLYFVSNQLLL